MQRHSGNVVPVQQQPSAVDIVEPGNQVDHSGFSRAGGAYQGDGFSRPHLKVEIFQDIHGAVIRERHIFKGDVALDRRQLRRIRSVVHSDRLVDHFENTLQIRHCVDKGVIQVGQVQDRLPEPPGIGRDGDQGADLYLRPKHHQPYKIHGAHHPSGDIVHGVPHQVGGVLGLHPGFIAVLVEFVVYPGVFLFPGEGLGDLHPVQALMEVGVQVGALVGNILPGSSLGRFNQQHQHQEQRHARHHDQRQFDVAGEHEDCNEDQVENFQHEIDNAVGQRIGHAVYIIYHTGENFPMWPVVIELEGELLQMLKQILPDVIDDLLPHHDHVFGTRPGKQDGEDDGYQHQHRQQHQLAYILFRRGPTRAQAAEMAE